MILRAFFLIKYVQGLDLSNQIRIFIKTMIEFTNYLVPYSLIATLFVLSTAVIALQHFSPEAYGYPFNETPVDKFLVYSISSLKIFFTTDWSTIMHRVALIHGRGLSIYFILQAVLCRFIIDNCFCAYFVFIFTDFFWRYIKEDPRKIGIVFEKTAVQKREMIGKYLFRATEKKKTLGEEQDAPLDKSTKHKDSLLLNSTRNKFKKNTKYVESTFMRMLSNSRNKMKKTTLYGINDQEVEEENQESDEEKELERKENLRRVGIVFRRNINRRPKKEGSEDSGRPDHDPETQADEVALKRLPTRLETSEFFLTERKMRQSVFEAFSPDKNMNDLTRKTLAQRSSKQHLTFRGVIDMTMGWNNGSATSKSSGKSVIGGFPGRHEEHSMSFLQSRLKNSTRQSKWLDFKKNKPPSRFVRFYSHKNYLRLSLAFSIASSVNIMLTTKPLGCSKVVSYYFAFASTWICNFFFCLEVFMIFYISKVNRGIQAQRDPKNKIAVRVSFSWFESVVLLGNLVHGVFLNFLCEGQNPANYLSGLACCMNFYRLVRRVPEFDKNFGILKDSFAFLAKDIQVFVFFICCFAGAGFSVYFNQVTYCTSTSGLRHPDKFCPSPAGQQSKYFVNYSEVYDGLLTGYLMVDRTIWYNILGLSLNSDSTIKVIHHIAHFLLLMFVCIYVNFCFRGVTVSLCYICIERAEIIQKNSSNLLSKIQFEWMRTEEFLAGIKLFRKVSKPTYLLARVCIRIKDSSFWNSAYYSIIILGFLLNIATYRLLTQVRGRAVVPEQVEGLPEHHRAGRDQPGRVPRLPVARLLRLVLRVEDRVSDA